MANEQPRDAKGKFLPKQPGQKVPGMSHEDSVEKWLKAKYGEDNVFRRVKIRTYDEFGRLHEGGTDVDFVVRDTKTGRLLLFDAKESIEGGLQPGQRFRWRDLQDYGGVVSSDKYPNGLPRGERIPPTKVEKIRPNNPEIMIFKATGSSPVSTRIMGSKGTSHPLNNRPAVGTSESGSRMNGQSNRMPTSSPKSRSYTPRAPVSRLVDLKLIRIQNRIILYFGTLNAISTLFVTLEIAEYFVIVKRAASGSGFILKEPLSQISKILDKSKKLLEQYTPINDAVTDITNDYHTVRNSKLDLRGEDAFKIVKNIFPLYKEIWKMRSPLEKQIKYLTDLYNEAVAKIAWASYMLKPRQIAITSAGTLTTAHSGKVALAREDWYKIKGRAKKSLEILKEVKEDYVDLDFQDLNEALEYFMSICQRYYPCRQKMAELVKTLNKEMSIIKPYSPIKVR